MSFWDIFWATNELIWPVYALYLAIYLFAIVMIHTTNQADS